MENSTFLGAIIKMKGDWIGHFIRGKKNNNKCTLKYSGRGNKKRKEVINVGRR